MFENAEAFDPDRFPCGKSGRSSYSPFGTDRHACIAVRSSSAVAQILVEELARSYRWRVTRDGPRERLLRRWHHWDRVLVSHCRCPEDMGSSVSPRSSSERLITYADNLC